jgi:hypothetical protein
MRRRQSKKHAAGGAFNFGTQRLQGPGVDGSFFNVFPSKELFLIECGLSAG